MIKIFPSFSVVDTKRLHQASEITCCMAVNYIILFQLTNLEEIARTSNYKCSYSIDNFSKRFTLK